MFTLKNNETITKDRILFEGAYPILFTCKNENDDLFLCVCCQFSGGIKKWLIVKSSANTIIKMLKDEITIRDAFMEADATNRYSVVSTDYNSYTVEVNNLDDWNETYSIFLPTYGCFMDVEDGEFDEDLEYFNSLM